MNRNRMVQSTRQEMKERMSRVDVEKLFDKISRPVRVLVISFLLVVGVFFGIYKFVETKYLAPVDKRDTTPIMVTIPRRSSLSSIVTILEEAGIVRSASAYKLYLDIYDKGSKLKSGNYELNKAMTLADVTDALMAGSMSADGTIKLQLTEGKTVEDLAQKLVDLSVFPSTTDFLKSMEEGTAYKDNAFIAASSEHDVKYVMEGYLFPDTYEIYVDDSEKAIVDRFLRRFNEIYTAEHQSKADELGLTMHQVITLASIIEKEARTADFHKVSAVFHNRLATKMRLQSCATAQYVLNTRKLVLTAEQREVDSPYNTYKISGLPAGPICNPGKAAIEAALDPDEEYVTQGYLYFCNNDDPTSGQLVFAKTYEEHSQNEAKYRQYWEAYDKGVE